MRKGASKNQARTHTNQIKPLKHVASPKTFTVLSCTPQSSASQKQLASGWLNLCDFSLLQHFFLFWGPQSLSQFFSLCLLCFLGFSQQEHVGQSVAPRRG